MATGLSAYGTVEGYQMPGDFTEQLPSLAVQACRTVQCFSDPVPGNVDITYQREGQRKLYLFFTAHDRHGSANKRLFIDVHSRAVKYVGGNGQGQRALGTPDFDHVLDRGTSFVYDVILRGYTSPTDQILACEAHRKEALSALQTSTPVQGRRPLASQPWHVATEIETEQDWSDVRGYGNSPHDAPAEDGAREGSCAADGPEGEGSSEQYDSDFMDDGDASSGLHTVSSPDDVSRKCSASSTTSGSAMAQQHASPDKGVVDVTSSRLPAELADPPPPHEVIQLRSGRTITRHESDEPEADVRSGDAPEQHPNSSPPGQAGSGLQRGMASGRKTCKPTLLSCGEQGTPQPQDAGAFVATPSKGLRRIEKRGLLDDTHGPAGPSALEQVDKLKRRRYQPADSDSEG